MEIQIVRDKMQKADLKKIAEEWGSDFVKGVVDVEKGIMAIGGEFHADEETLLIEREESERKNLWGVNLYPNRSEEEWVGFDSLINIRPSQGNRSMNVDDRDTLEKIKKVIDALIS